jgi:hypothetical protein
MILERDRVSYLPFKPEIAAAAQIPFAAHRHSVVAAHRRVTAARDNNTDLGP